ncbi:HEPN domain-containing protein [Staphylococcus kloosii]|uniref:Uncharacterized protein n=1 Tax=Staphylococcus kloosii TaxID=29384 RepID=A0A151A3I2_9STAP|nr:HEPN domain-containing protein [Staphylococcus kloosii]KYH13873.1 hypothetical protein A0131_03510 [Staphylococcus kloosii]MCD8879340.1 hypothetical protein [Staphylococcus kloosii]
MKEKRIIDKDLYSLDDIENLKVNFMYNSHHIYTENNQLVINIKKEINEIDGVIEAKRYARTDAIILNNILTFLTGSLFTVYQKKSSEININQNSEKYDNNFCFNYQGNNYYEDLKKILGKISNKDDKYLIITLLDRWRKSLFLLELVESDDLYDEAFLSYFHILELLANENNKIKKQNNLPIRKKLLNFLESYGLFDKKTKELVRKLINLRNEIAHGKLTYKDLHTWPLPAFLNITNSTAYNLLYEIQILSAKAISNFLGIGLWEKAWQEIHDGLPFGNGIYNNILKEYDGFNFLDLKDKYKFDLEGLFEFYLNNHSRINISKMENILFEFLFSEEYAKEYDEVLLLVSVILADSKNKKLSSKAKQKFRVLFRGIEVTSFSNIKDIYSYMLEYGIELKWFYKWLKHFDK